MRAFLADTEAVRMSTMGFVVIATILLTLFTQPVYLPFLETWL